MAGFYPCILNCLVDGFGAEKMVLVEFKKRFNIKPRIISIAELSKLVIDALHLGVELHRIDVHITCHGCAPRIHRLQFINALLILAVPSRRAGWIE